MIKNIIQKIFVIIWCVLLVGLAAYYVIAAPKGSTYSEEENRKLAEMPELTAKNVLNGDFGEGIEAFLLDRFPNRHSIISASNKVQNFISIATYEDYLLIADTPDDPLDSGADSDDLDDLINDLISNKDDKDNEETTDEPTSSDEEISSTEEPTTEDESQKEYPPIEEKPEMYITDFPEKLGVYMHINNKKVTTNTYERDNVVAVTAVLNKYASYLPENGKLMFTVVPQSRQANKFVNAKEKIDFYANWDDVVNGLGSDNVYAFDSAEILEPAIKNNDYVYFRTDMHWTPYGSYLVYREMVSRAGHIPCDYDDDFTHTMEEPFRGTYYRNQPDAYMDVPPDSLDLLMPKFNLEWRRTTHKDEYKLIDFLNFNARKNDRYTVYLGGPAGPWTYAECNNDKEENCLLLTDSFGLGYLPFLTANYKQVHYYDPRYFNKDDVGYSVAEMMEKYNIQDVYVVVGDLHSFNSGFLSTSANKQLDE